MITVNVNTSLVGKVHVLDESHVDNWSEIIDLITTTSCTFTINYNEIVYSGDIAKSIDGTKLLVAFNDDNYVALPSGMCLIVDCGESQEPEECPNLSQTLTVQTKLSVLDENGCPIGYITFQQIKDAIVQEIELGEIEINFCDLLPEGEIPQGDLVAGDRILTTSGGCTLKSVSQTDISCP